MLNLDNYPEILTIKEASEILRVSKLTLKRWEKKGKIQSIRINSRGDRRYTKQQILALLGDTPGSPEVKAPFTYQDW